MLFIFYADRLLYNAGQKKRNSELRIFRVPPEGGGSTPLQHPFTNSQPPSKLIYLFQGAHKKLMDQSCVSFDQHCTLTLVPNTSEMVH